MKRTFQQKNFLKKTRTKFKKKMLTTEKTNEKLI